MQVTQEAIEPCQIALTIEVEPDKVVHAVDKAYREYAKYVSVPGFRKGKAPMTFVRQRVPEADVRQRAAEILVEPAYADALKETEIEPFAAPKLELIQLDLTETPFIFKAIVPLAPSIELGSYTGIAVDRKIYEMSEQDVDQQIERFRERYTEYPIVERPIALGDLVIADVSAEVEGRLDLADPRPTMIEVGGDNIPGFDDQIVGLEVGSEKTFTLTYPDNYPDAELVGQNAEFHVTIKEVREKAIPPFDDAMAEKITNGRITDVETLKTELRTDMQRSLMQSSERELEGSLIDQILAQSTVKFPPVLTESEVNSLVESLLSSLKENDIPLETYLQRQGKSREQLLAEYHTTAEKRIEIGLLLGEIAQVENLALTDEDIEAAIEAQAEDLGIPTAAVRAYLESTDGMTEISNKAQARKVIDFLLSASVITDVTVQPGTVPAEIETETSEE